MKILVFDTETGGLNPRDNDILQLSYQIVDLENRDVVKSVDRFFPWPKDKSRVSWGVINVKTDDINRHDSSADVELTKRCFIHLLEKDFYKF